MLRALFKLLRHRTTNASRFASRFNRAARYGLDLVLWSRLFSKRRDPVPLEFPPRLLAAKGVACGPPALHVSGTPARADPWDDGFAAVYATLLLNLQTPNALSEVRYAHPAPAFSGVYLWDSAFTSQVWRLWDPRVAQEVLQAVIDLRSGDRLQHVVAELAESAYTQPPLVAWAVEQLHAESGLEPKFLGHAFEALSAYNGWLLRRRRLDNGLFAWAHPYESGIDNAPRFSTADERRMADTTRLASPDFSTYMVLQAESLARLATHLGHPVEAERFNAQAEEVRRLTNELLWHEGRGLYLDRHAETGEFVESDTIASLLPLWAGVPDTDRARRLRDHILSPAYNTLIPLPTVARNDPAFEKDMWRGPVWINTAYAVIQGLERYGYLHEAGDLACRLCEGVFRTYDGRRRVYEFYDPDRCDIDQLSRKRGNLWKKFTLGDKPVREFVGWSGLVNTLTIEVLMGLRQRGGSFELRPLLPASAAGLRFCLRLPNHALAVEVERVGEGFEATVRSEQGVERHEIRFGETATIRRP